MYNPHRDVSIDEAIKRGFKVWVRGDPTNGYVSQLDIYVGKMKL
jgi:hypothetical protein